MAVTAHGHHIPGTPHMDFDQDTVPIDCGGVISCHECRTYCTNVRASKGSRSRCKIDNRLKRIHLVDGTFRAGRIPWCTTHLTIYDGHASKKDQLPSCVARLEALGETVDDEKEIVDQTESVGDLLRSMSENCVELAEALVKLANILEKKD